MEIFTPLDITRIKSVTDNVLGRAYIDLGSDIFVLHWPDSKRGNILNASTTEIIVLYQKLNFDRKMLTHLVVPIDNVETPERGQNNYRYGRQVKVIAATGVENAIEFSSTSLSELNFRNRAWGTAELLTRISNSADVSRFQVDIWNRFSPFFTEEFKSVESEFLVQMQQEQNQYDDDNIYGEEGSLKIVTHKIRERNSRLVQKRKQQALLNHKLECEACGFSFIDTYGQQYIECHHDKPISEGFRVTDSSDLRLVCSNCHRMLHRRINGEYLTIEGLKTLLERQGKRSK